MEVNEQKENHSNDLLSDRQKEAIEKLRLLGKELPAVVPLVNLKTNNVFAEPGP